jgi:beta-N-acetylhexosaminidase
MTKPIIFGCSGKTLTLAERNFFEETQPFGFILFARNIETPEQVRNLVNELKSCVAHEFVPILIDQEGGRVCRLKPPFWSHPAACGTFEADNDPERAAYNSAKAIAVELANLGINVDCAPMLDVRQPDAHDIVGDRAFSTDPKVVAALGKSFAEGLTENGVAPVIKHIPGHGRAQADSHFDLPVVTASLEELREVDFYPFKELNYAPFAMTAHIIYEAIDPHNCATQSKKVIDIIRNEIGFKGMIMTDDLSMKALTGTFAERTKRSLDAGCDIILHCNGDMNEMKQIADAVGEITLPMEQLAQQA